MRKYEVMFILRPDLDEEKINELVERFKNIITENGGELTKVDTWGKRRLAYEIQHVREGYYVVFQFNSQPDVAKEMDRVLKITDGVLRHIIVREDV